MACFLAPVVEAFAVTIIRKRVKQREIACISRHGAPVRSTQNTPLKNLRLSSAIPPHCPFLPRQMRGQQCPNRV